jgi:Family of unknown function (DUF6527)
MSAWFEWRGKHYPVVQGLPGSYTIACPQCGDGIPCNGPPRDELAVSHYNVSVRADGALTLNPSVVCPRCQWHVIITDGQAVP